MLHVGRVLAAPCGSRAARAVAIVLTHVEFPSRYFDLINEQTSVILVVAGRNAVLLVALVVLVAGLSARPGARADVVRRRH